MKRVSILGLVLLAAMPLFAGDGAAKAFHDMAANFEAAAAAGNLDGVVAIYADDAVVMPPNMPAVRGKAAIRTFWSQLGKSDIDVTIDDVQMQGDLAVERGTFKMTTPFQDSGKYVMVWRKTDGKWLAVTDIFNSDVAPPAPAH